MLVAHEQLVELTGGLEGEVLPFAVSGWGRQKARPDLDPAVTAYSAIAQAHRTGCYSPKEIAEPFGVHYATVSRG